jgi:hypothetical protein
MTSNLMIREIGVVSWLERAIAHRYRQKASKSIMDKFKTINASLLRARTIVELAADYIKLK